MCLSSLSNRKRYRDHHNDPDDPNDSPEQGHKKFWDKVAVKQQQARQNLKSKLKYNKGEAKLFRKIRDVAEQAEKNANADCDEDWCSCEITYEHCESTLEAAAYNEYCKYTITCIMSGYCWG